MIYVFPTSRLRERARARLTCVAERFFAIARFQKNVASVANADHDRVIARAVQRLPLLNRAFGVLPTVNDDAHPDRPDGSQFD